MVDQEKNLPPPKIVLAIFFAVAALQIPADLITGRLSAGWGILINESLFILATPILILKLTGFSLPSFTPLRRMGARRLVAALCFTMGSAVLIGYAQGISFEIVEIPRFLLERRPRPMEVVSFEDFYLKLVLLCLVAPFCEEFLFRGVIQTSLAKSLGNARAVILTAVFFTLIHSATFQPHLYLVLGLALSFIYAATNSLRTAIICHAVYNTWVLSNQIHGISFPLESPPGEGDALLVAMSFVIVGAGAVWMARMMPHSKKSAG